ncbi:hypothetical protein WMY93_029928 [Mugilogobius chulae]|uniref:G-protein coupled receptors family 1 profile domain-containing protein n=1 Tax=Mugilogobius chulae TaxID=88201 RepID=A0AAW0MUA1_9GOBI
MVFAFSLGANVLVLIIIYRFERLTTVTNILLLNLQPAFVATYLFLSHWPFGGVMCRLVGSLYYLGFFSSVLFLTLMTFDRHLAVVYSIGASRLRTRTYALLSCLAVWMFSALACVKPMIVHKLLFLAVNEVMLCQEDPDTEDTTLMDVGFYMQLIVFFLIPLLLIAYCYARIACTVLSSHIGTKFKTVRLIFVIVLLFFVCWTPFNVALLMSRIASACDEQNYWKRMVEITRHFTHIYFCISPFSTRLSGKVSEVLSHFTGQTLPEIGEARFDQSE